MTRLALAGKCGGFGSQRVRRACRAGHAAEAHHAESGAHGAAVIRVASSSSPNSPTRIRSSSAAPAHTRSSRSSRRTPARARSSSADGARPYRIRYACRTRSAIVAASAASASAAACVLHEAAVHQEQPLQRDVRDHALLAGVVRIREIEQRQHGVELAPADETVDGAPIVLRRRAARAVRPPVRSRLPETNSSESRSVSASRRCQLARQSSRLSGSAASFAGDVFRAQRVDRRKHDLAMHRLDRPLVLHEAARPDNPAVPDATAARPCCRNCWASPRSRGRNDAARCDSR